MPAKNKLSTAVTQALGPSHQRDEDARSMAILLQRCVVDRIMRLVDEDRLAAIIVAERDAPGSRNIRVTQHGSLSTALQAAAHMLQSHARGNASESHPS